MWRSIVLKGIVGGKLSGTLAAVDANSLTAAASRDPSAAETRQRASQVPLFVFEQAA